MQFVVRLSCAVAILALTGCSAIYGAKRGGTLKLREADTGVVSRHEYDITSIELWDRSGVLLSSVANYSERQRAAREAWSRGKTFFSARSYDPDEFNRINLGLGYGRGWIQPRGGEESERESFHWFRMSLLFPKLWLLPFFYLEGTSELRVLTGDPVSGMWGGAQGDAILMLPFLPLRLRGRGGVGMVGLTYGGFVELVPRNKWFQSTVQLGWERTGYYASTHDQIIAREGALRVGFSFVW